MEEIDQGQKGYSPAHILSTCADCMDDDTPTPERIVLQRVSDEVYVVRLEVLDSDQPYGCTFRLDKDR